MGITGLFAATEFGLYHSHAGTEWTDLGVPEEMVSAVAATADSSRPYAGTRPAHLYVADIESDSVTTEALEWRELDGFQRLPSRSTWRTPRHDNVAQVSDVTVPKAGGDSVVAAVEVGGVSEVRRWRNVV